MKLEKILIGVLLLIVAWLVLHKQPTLPTEIRYITKLEKRLDTLYRDTIVFKTKIRRFKDTILIYRDSVIVAKESNDTVKIIAFQDSVIEQQDYTIKWQDTLIGQLDTIVDVQNKVNDKLKDSIIDLNKDVLKRKKRSKLTHLISVGVLTFFVVK
jgi:hypothetical protein